MKKELTVAETHKLIALGVSVGKASGDYHFNPVFTMGDLMAILPNAIGAYQATCTLCITWDFREKKWRAYYVGHDVFYASSLELIDAMYELVKLLINNKYA